jgi:hypothetical protein
VRLFGRADAIRTTAELLEIAPTARGYRETGRRDVQQSLKLLVALPGSAPARVTLVTRVPWDRTPLVGYSIPVTVDVAHRKLVRVLWAEMPSLTARSLASAEAARSGDATGAARVLGFELRQPET